MKNWLRLHKFILPACRNLALINHHRYALRQRTHQLIRHCASRLCNLVNWQNSTSLNEDVIDYLYLQMLHNNLRSMAHLKFTNLLQLACLTKQQEWELMRALICLPDGGSCQYGRRLLTMLYIFKIATSTYARAKHRHYCLHHFFLRANRNILQPGNVKF